MATSERVYNVILDVAVMMDEKGVYRTDKGSIERMFWNVDGDVVDRLIKENPDSRYEVLVSRCGL